MEFKITKRSKLLSVRNDWAAIDYWLINGRIYTDDGTRYQPFKFVLVLDLSSDLWDADGDEIDYRAALDDMIFSFTDCLYGGQFSEKRIARFIDLCNDTINRYNRKSA